MGALRHSFSLPAKIGTVSAGISAGKFALTRGCDPRGFYHAFRDCWPGFIRHNFRNSTDAACFFGVDEKTARGWLEGHTSPRGQVVAFAMHEMPDACKAFMGGAA